MSSYKIDLYLDRLRQAYEQALQDGLEDAGKEIVAVASVLAPKDTGALSRSGKVNKIPSGVEIVFGEENSEDIDDARAIFMEFGTVRNAAQPFLTPAADAVDVEFFVIDRIKRI